MTYAEPFKTIRETTLNRVRAHAQSSTEPIAIDYWYAWYIIMFPETTIVQGDVYILGTRVLFT